MKILFLALSFMAITSVSYAQEETNDEHPIMGETPAKNNWGAKLRTSNFHLGLDLQTKYLWRGMEMMSEESVPVFFPCVNYLWYGLYAYVMGGYAINGKYAEVDLGISYSWKGFTMGLNDYYYPTISGEDDEYLGGNHNGHWLEVTLTYAPEKVPLWITASNFFAGDDDKYADDNGGMKQAYSTYLEIGTYYDFLANNRISLAVGMTPSKSCYNNYEKDFSVCNIDLKYTYNVSFKSGWTLPVSAEYIYNPAFDKSYVNFVANLAF